MQVCPNLNCKREVADSEDFCPYCGTMIREVSNVPKRLRNMSSGELYGEMTAFREATSEDRQYYDRLYVLDKDKDDLLAKSKSSAPIVIAAAVALAFVAPAAFFIFAGIAGALLVFVPYGSDLTSGTLADSTVLETPLMITLVIAVILTVVAIVLVVYLGFAYRKRAAKRADKAADEYREISLYLANRYLAMDDPVVAFQYSDPEILTRIMEEIVRPGRASSAIRAEEEYENQLEYDEQVNAAKAAAKRQRNRGIILASAFTLASQIPCEQEVKVKFS